VIPNTLLLALNLAKKSRFLANATVRAFEHKTRLSPHLDEQRYARVAQSREYTTLPRQRPAERPYNIQSRDESRKQGTDQGSDQKSSVPLSKYRSELKRAILMQIIQNPKATDLKICRGLDADGAVELPSDWKLRAGDRLFA
jgi:hypothetical protein